MKKEEGKKKKKRKGMETICVWMAMILYGILWVCMDCNGLAWMNGFVWILVCFISRV